MDNVTPSKISFLSKVFFLWTRDNVNQFKDNLKELPDDSGPTSLPEGLSSKKWGPQFSEIFEAEKETYKRKLNKSLQHETRFPNEHKSTKSLLIGPFFISLVKTYKGFLFSTLLLLLIHRLSKMMTHPYMMALLIRCQASGENNRYLKSFLISVSMLALLVFSSFLHRWCGFLIGACRIAVDSGVSCLALNKSLNLTPAARQRRSKGEINNILTIHIRELAGHISEIPYKLTAFFNVAGNFFLLYIYAGPSAFLAVAIMAAAVFFCSLSSKEQEHFTRLVSDTQDKKIHIFSQMLRGMKVVKLYAWEKIFAQKIEKVLDEELLYQKKFILFGMFPQMLWFVVPMLSITVIFIWNLFDNAQGEFFRPENMFSVFILMNDMRFFLDEMPSVFYFLITVKEKLRKIEPLLLEDQLENLSEESILKEKESESSSLAPNNTFSIQLNNVNLSWDQQPGNSFLKDINLEIEEGKLTLITGQVGSGKSSLLSTFLKDLTPRQGVVKVRGRMSYVPQEPWLQHDTIRNNILFGAEMNREKYESVVKCCALRRDLEILPQNDQTLVGEKGVILSGGQKQRISLARAVYSDSDVFILDDPLSAVDANVGLYIMNRLLSSNGLLKSKTRVMVTHGLHWLPHADHIIHLRKVQGGYTSENLSFEEAESKLIIDNNPTPENSKTIERANSEIVEKNSKTKQKEIDSDEDEELQVNSDGSGLFAYIKAFGVTRFFILEGIQLLMALTFAFSGIWQSRWSQHIALVDKKNSKTCSTISEEKCIQAGNDDEIWAIHKYYISYYCVGILAATIIVASYYTLSATFTTRTTRRITHSLLWSIVRSPLQFFNVTPLGKIVQRFGFDMTQVGGEIPIDIEYLLNGVFGTGMALCMIALVCPSVSPLILILSYLLLKIIRRNLTNNAILNCASKSRQDTLCSKAFETIEGSTVIRAFGHKLRFIELYQKYQDFANEVSYIAQAESTQMTLHLALCSQIFVVVSSLFAALLMGGSDGGTSIALVVTFALEIDPSVLWLALMIGETNNAIVSMERVASFLSLPCEREWESKDSLSTTTWLKSGKVEFKNLFLSYKENSQPVLKDISLKILPGEKIGIIGRTGAGKTSLVSSLFRLVEPLSGNIFIDDMDITALGLHDLRSKIAVIPQDPVLFSGTLRSNLDPSDSYTDKRLLEALEHVHIIDAVKSLPGKLNWECSGDESSLSVGQKQLICLARAILKQCKIIVLDEATSSVDSKTDSLVQDTIREQFSGCTVITIAHRLQTVSDYDRIVLMESGKIQAVGSFDNVTELFHKTNSTSDS